MSILLAFYAVAVLVIIGLAVGAYRLLAKRSRILAAGVSALLLSGMVLLWPVPIHGGFTFLGEILYRELGRALEQRAGDAGQRQTEAFTRQIEARFAGPLEFSVTERLSEHWSRVLIGDNGSVWHHGSSDMLWSEWLPLDTQSPLPSLDSARARCRQYPPSGYWALISEAENYLLWKSRAYELLPPAPVSTISELIELRPPMRTPTYDLRTASPDANQRGGRRIGEPRSFVVRCVARGPHAPAGGITRKDIPLAEWNRFQLLKGLQ